MSLPIALLALQRVYQFAFVSLSSSRSSGLHLEAVEIYLESLIFQHCSRIRPLFVSGRVSGQSSLKLHST